MNASYMIPGSPIDPTIKKRPMIKSNAYMNLRTRKKSVPILGEMRLASDHKHLFIYENGTWAKYMISTKQFPNWVWVEEYGVFRHHIPNKEVDEVDIRFRDFQNIEELTKYLEKINMPKEFRNETLKSAKYYYKKEV